MTTYTDFLLKIDMGILNGQLIIVTTMRHAIRIYVDGACRGNPGIGGWGCYMICNVSGTRISWSWYGGKRHTTNNEMELTGILNGLRIAPISNDIVVYADTQYGLKGLVNNINNGAVTRNKLKNDVIFTGWVDGWSRNGWITSSRTAVKNKQLWIDIMTECKKHVLGGSTLQFQWVKGHAGIEGNEMADKLANLGIESA